MTWSLTLKYTFSILQRDEISVPILGPNINNHISRCKGNREAVKSSTEALPNYA